MIYKRARAIREEFWRKKLSAKPWSNNTTMCSLTQLYIARWFCAGPLKGRESLETVRQKVIEAGEDPEEWCILVGLRTAPPGGFSLPKKYRGLEVFAFIADEVRANKKGE